MGETESPIFLRSFLVFFLGANVRSSEQVRRGRRPQTQTSSRSPILLYTLVGLGKLLLLNIHIRILYSGQVKNLPKGPCFVYIDKWLVCWAFQPAAQSVI